MKNNLTNAGVVLFAFLIASFFWMMYNFFLQIINDETINGYSIASFVIFGLLFFRIIFSIGEIDNEDEQKKDN